MSNLGLDYDIVTRFIFNDTVIVEIASDYDDMVMVEVMDKDDPEDRGRSFHLEPDEIDVFVAALNLYKHRILQKRPFGRTTK